MTSKEEWVVVSAAPDYEVSSLGRVRRCTPGKNTYVGRLLETHTDKNGYRRFRAHGAGGGKVLFLRGVVCRAFHGPRPFPGAEAAHENGVPGDDRAANLSWKTAQGNADDRDRHGKTARGVRHGCAVLTDIDVRAIRSCSESSSVLAALYGVSSSAIRQARRGYRWAHVA